MLGNFFFLLFSQKRQQKGQKLKDTVGKIKKNLSGELKRKKKRKEITLRRLRYVKIQFVSFKKERVCQAWNPQKKVDVNLNCNVYLRFICKFHNSPNADRGRRVIIFGAPRCPTTTTTTRLTHVIKQQFRAERTPSLNQLVALFVCFFVLFSRKRERTLKQGVGGRRKRLLFWCA